MAEYIRKQMQEDISYDQKTLEENVDPYTGKQVKEGKSKAPLVAASESVAVGKPWSYALRGQCILPARPVVMIFITYFSCFRRRREPPFRGRHENR